MVWLLQDGNGNHGYKVFVYMILADFVLSLIGGFIYLFFVLNWCFLVSKSVHFLLELSARKLDLNVFVNLSMFGKLEPVHASSCSSTCSLSKENSSIPFDLGSHPYTCSFIFCLPVYIG